MTCMQVARLAVAVAASLIFLWLAFRGIDGEALWASMRALNPWGLGVYVVALCFIQVARAVRWGILVAPFASLAPKRIWQISNVGNMWIMLLPLRLGELARPMMMRQACGVSLAAGLGAATIERVLDGLLVTLLFFAVTYAQKDAALPHALVHGARLALGIFIAALAALALAAWCKRAFYPILEATLGRLSQRFCARIIAMLESFVLGLKALPDAQTFFGVVGWTLAYWVANALGLYALMLGFELNLPLIAAFTVVCVLVVGVMIPAGPGLLGTYQAALMAGLSIYHVDKNVSAALSVVAYLGNLAIIVAFGLPSVREVSAHRAQTSA